MEHALKSTYLSKLNIILLSISFFMYCCFYKAWCRGATTWCSMLGFVALSSASMLSPNRVIAKYVQCCAYCCSSSLLWSAWQSNSSTTTPNIFIIIHKNTYIESIKSYHLEFYLSKIVHIAYSAKTLHRRAEG